MIQKKICMLGAFAVGKTSLVSRFVHSIFPERYLTTVGVKVDKKLIQVAGREMSLILWDLHGEDEFQKVRMSYLRGSAGYLLVVDRTRRATLDTAAALQEETERVLGPVPFVLALNKSDLREEWDLDEATFARLAGRGWTVIETSAKTGQGVEEAFVTLGQKIVIS
ncbi:MAG: Rab family GTPase [Acidobacteriota bacterium]